MDVMVAPERQRQGLGEVLFRTWDRNVGASLGLGLSESSHRLFQKLRWPDVGPVPVPRQAADPPRAAHPTGPSASTASSPLSRCRSSKSSRARGRSAPKCADPAVRRELHRALGVAGAEVRLRRPARRRVPELEVRDRRRTSATRSWRCAATSATSATRSTGISREPRGRVTLLVDFLVDPDDEAGFRTLLRWVDREARQADSDKIRTFAMHAGFRRVLRRSGYFQVKSTMEFVVKVNGVEVAPRFTRTPIAGT